MRRICECKEQSYDLILEADYGADAIWCKNCGWNLDIYYIHLSQELKKELEDWVGTYSNSVLDESEYIYEVSQKHNRNGLKLLEKVKKELGIKYTVSYKPS
jgi:hypothetical protein